MPVADKPCSAWNPSAMLNIGVRRVGSSRKIRASLVDGGCFDRIDVSRDLSGELPRPSLGRDAVNTTLIKSASSGNGESFHFVPKKARVQECALHSGQADGRVCRSDDMTYPGRFYTSFLAINRFILSY
jgi:hypothetical protein